MAEHNSWKNQGRQQHGWFGHGTDKLDTTQNIRDLAQVIQTEAEGEGAEAKVAVGHVLLNRMQRNGKAKVHDVWNGFAHHKQPDRETLTIARSIPMVKARIRRVAPRTSTPRIFCRVRNSEPAARMCKTVSNKYSASRIRRVYRSRPIGQDMRL